MRAVLLSLVLVAPGCSAITQSAVARVTEYGIQALDRHDKAVQEKTEAIVGAAKATLDAKIEAGLAKYGEGAQSIAKGAADMAATKTGDWLVERGQALDKREAEIRAIPSEERSIGDNLNLLLAALGSAGLLGAGGALRGRQEKAAAEEKRDALKAGAILMAANPQNGGKDDAKAL